MEKLTVAKLIEGVEKKQFLLPTIQRGFVWKTKKIEKLFNSLMRDFPISSFLFWEVPDEDENTFRFYDFVKDYNFYSEEPNTISTKSSYIPKGESETPQNVTTKPFGFPSEKFWTRNLMTA